MRATCDAIISTAVRVFTLIALPLLALSLEKFGFLGFELFFLTISFVFIIMVFKTRQTSELS